MAAAKPKNNLVGWFEIPVRKMERAAKFYEAVFGQKLQREKMGKMDMAWFPYAEKGMGAGGSLVLGTGYKPGPGGVFIYFSSPSGDLSKELAKVARAGGRVLQKKTLISKDIGYMATIVDTEGNKIALHSMK